MLCTCDVCERGKIAQLPLRKKKNAINVLLPSKIYVIKTCQLSTVRVIVAPLGIWYHLSASLCLALSV